MGTTTERNQQLAESREHLLADDSKHIDNLEMLVVRLARHVEKMSGGDSKMADQAMGYMKRQARGAQSILREHS